MYSNKKLLILVIVTILCASANGQKKSRYSFPKVDNNSLAKGTFFYGFHLCKLNKLQMATPDTEEKNNELLEFIEENSLATVWIALTDLAQEGEFSWLTTGNNVTYTYWHGSQPDNYANIEHCAEVVYVYHDVRWNDKDCRATSTIVCEDADEFDINVRTKSR